MFNKKIFCIAVILLLFGIFSSYIYYSQLSYEVIEVVTPTKFVIDFNRNRTVDNNETVCLAGLESFSLTPTEEFLTKYEQKFNLGYTGIMNLGYLAQEFSQKNLQNRKVRIKYSNEKSNDCVPVNLFLNGTDYNGIFYNSGFAINNDGQVNKSKFDIRITVGRGNL